MITNLNKIRSGKHPDLSGIKFTNKQGKPYGGQYLVQSFYCSDADKIAHLGKLVSDKQISKCIYTVYHKLSSQEGIPMFVILWKQHRKTLSHAYKLEYMYGGSHE